MLDVSKTEVKLNKDCYFEGCTFQCNFRCTCLCYLYLASINFTRQCVCVEKWRFSDLPGNVSLSYLYWGAATKLKAARRLIAVRHYHNCTWDVCSICFALSSSLNIIFVGRYLMLGGNAVDWSLVMDDFGKWWMHGTFTPICDVDLFHFWCGLYVCSVWRSVLTIE